MSYTTPTATEFKAAYTDFSQVADGVVDDAISQSAAFVGNKWIEANYQRGRMLYAAHILTVTGQGDSVEAQLAANGDFKTIDSGDLKLERTGSVSNSQDPLDTTRYGRMFKELRRASVLSIGIY